MLLETVSMEFRKARSVNQTSNGYVSKIPTNTEPSGDAGTATGASIIDLTNGGITSQSAALIVPYGVGSNNNTFSFRAIGWRKLRTPTTTGFTTLWIPIPLGEWQVTLTSSMVGVAGKDIVATELFADTITIVGTTGGTNATAGISSPIADIAAYVCFDLRGFQKLELSFTTDGSATSCNALVALL